MHPKGCIINYREKGDTKMMIKRTVDSRAKREEFEVAFAEEYKVALEASYNNEDHKATAEEIAIIKACNEHMLAFGVPKAYTFWV